MKLKYPSEYYYIVGMNISFSAIIVVMGLWMLIESTMSNNMSKAILAVLILLISLPVIYFFEKDRRKIKARFDRLLEAGYTKSIVPLVYEIGEQVRILRKQDPINYKGYIEKLLELEEMEVGQNG